MRALGRLGRRAVCGCLFLGIIRVREHAVDVDELA